MPNEISVVPENPEAARAEIERTRARMSETLDEIEDALVRKKEEIRERLDVVARIRDQPLKAAGIALGAGLFLGLVSGGRKKDPEAERRRLGAETRAARWEARARRLLAIAREQEAELEHLEDVVGDLLATVSRLEADDPEADGWEDEEVDGEYLDEEDAPSRWSSLRESLEEGGARLASQARRVRELRRRR
jgi:ElaB/YqjD/DUF883 family membrane-anchored ribosome-binding protein